MIPHVVNVPSTKRGFPAPSQHTLYTSVANEVVSASRKRANKNTQWKKCAVRARPCTVNSGAWATHLALLLDHYPLANVILGNFGHLLLHKRHSTLFLMSILLLKSREVDDLGRP